MYLDDLHEGFAFDTGRRALPLEAIVDFARQWDPQPFHTDPDAESPFGGIIASGFQTMLTAFVLTLETGIWAEASMGSPGMDDFRWLIPVRPDDELRCRGTVLCVTPSRSRPDRGRADIAYQVFNQRDEVVMTYRATHILRRYPPAAS